MSDLHGKIHAEVERRLKVARAATPGPWDYATVHPFMDGRVQARIGPHGRPRVLADTMHAVDMWFIAEHDPADAIRRYEYALKVLDRHQGYQIPAGHKWAGSYNCERCNGMVWPCSEVADLAASLGIEVSS